MVYRFMLPSLFFLSTLASAHGQHQAVSTPGLRAASPAYQAQVQQGTPLSPKTTIPAAPAAADETPATAPGTTQAIPPSAARSVSTVAPPDPSESSSTYVIGPQDSLQVNVWKEPGLSGTFPVRPDGMISLSLIGEVDAAGKTPRKLGDEVAARLKKYITDPSVNVVVLAVFPKQVYLLGEVAHVGALAITPEMTPLQAIAAAGGVTAFAKTKNIYILRGLQGKQRKIFFNYKKAIKDGNEQGVSLVPGDTIVVP